MIRRAALLLAVLLSPAAALAQTATGSGSLPPGLGSMSGSTSNMNIEDGRIGGAGSAANPRFRELRVDGPAGPLNSYVRIGPSIGDRSQGQGQSSTGSARTTGTAGGGERRAPELFKLGGNIKF
ncbi:MAG: hypothetical protein FJX11_00185 [Alphaproteobacteria bacterium]|nr:hypothetical protein [Alphaproteobacteria bacterium]